MKQKELMKKILKELRLDEKTGYLVIAEKTGYDKNYVNRVINDLNPLTVVFLSKIDRAFKKKNLLLKYNEIDIKKFILKK